jgi:hypothetical protein
MMRERKHCSLTWWAFCSQIRLAQNVQVEEEVSERSRALARTKERGLLLRPQLLDATGFHFDFQIEIFDHEISEMPLLSESERLGTV